VYAGHAAIALVAKARRPNIPIGVLVAVSFGPDWIAWVFDLLHRRNELISHSLVSLAIGATLSAVAYFIATRDSRDSAVVALTYLLHWPADFITGIKQTWPGGPEVGLHIYEHPFADFLIESVVVIACWLVYRMSVPAARRRLSLLIPAGLIMLQVGFGLIQQPAIREPLREAVTGGGA
jgi:hypothetical protein